MTLNDKAIEEMTEEIVEWIRDMMLKTGGKSIVIGISGGKDSSVVAALCKEALGQDNVYGVLMPNGPQKDISFAREICDLLKIRSIEVPINTITDSFYKALSAGKEGFYDEISEQTKLNLPPRVRMTLLYAVSQSIDSSRVVNTSNISEDWVGYATIYGDTAGAFAPIGMLTTDEVVQIGRHLGIPEKFIVKPPEDGLTGKTDEDVLGFSYQQLNTYIREGKIDDESIKGKIDKMHKNSRFKFKPIPMFDADLPIRADDIDGIYKK